MEDDLLVQYDQLIPLRIGEVDYLVPENNNLLRCFQYLRLYPISMGGFCWSGECHTCEVSVRMAPGAEPQKVLACQTTIAQGMTILAMTDSLKFCLRDLATKTGDRLPLQGSGSGSEIGNDK